MGRMGVREVVRAIPGARWAARGVRSIRARLAPKGGGSALRYGDSPANFSVRRDLWLLSVRNLFSRQTIVDPSSTWVVSSTTHGSRIKRVHLAIESVGRGVAKPGRYVLWLDDDRLFARLPLTLRRLQRRGLEIALVEPGLQVHTKYWPYVEAVREHVDPLVVCDDDIVYPPTWLHELTEAARQHPEQIVAFRTHTIRLDGDAIGAYVSWTPTTSSEPAFKHFPTAVSGTVLPATLLQISRSRGRAFLTEAPMNDDVWLHALAVDAGIATVQVRNEPQHFPFVPRTQGAGLYMTNVADGGNDRQIARSYSKKAVARLIDEVSASGARAL